MTNAAALSVGWIGLGRMGEAMVKRLTAAGHGVKVWNRTRAKALPLADYGASIVDAKLDLAGCDVVFTMVSTTDDLKEVLFGEGGLVTGPKKPTMVVDSSSISQEGSAEIRQRLEAQGVAYLCAPVSGQRQGGQGRQAAHRGLGPEGALRARGAAAAGHGPQDDVGGEGELARSVWKIAHNTMFGVIIQSLCEITVLAEKAGIPRHVFLESINDSVLGSMYTRYKSPVLTNLTFEQVTFTPKLLLKDMDLGLGAGKAQGVAMPAAAATRESVARLVGRGYDNVDFAVLLKEMAADAGLELKPENVKVDDGLAG